MTERFLCRQEVEDRVGLTRSTIYRHMAAGTFPRPKQTGPNSVRWPESSIDRWQATRPYTTPANDAPAHP